MGTTSSFDWAGLGDQLERFDDPIGKPGLGPVSPRWIGLKRAWRMAWHFKALMALLAVGGLALEALAGIAGGDTVALIAIVPMLALAVLGTYLLVAFMLGILQAVTAWPLHDLEGWFGGLPWWGQLLALPVLIGFVCIPTIIAFIAALVLTLASVGLIK